MTPRYMRDVLLVLIVVKVLITAWNAYAYHGVQYDPAHHMRRIATGGLEITPEAYNPPLYYLPALGAKHIHKAIDPENAVRGDQLFRDLRFMNVAYTAMFYLLWSFVIFPAILPNLTSAFVASLLLLAIPGFQKLAMMAHPDNLVPLTSAGALAIWLCKRNGEPSGEPLPRWPSLILLGASIGLIGLTRPFAAGSVVSLWAVAMLDEWLNLRGRLSRVLSRALVFTTLVAVISLSWYAVRFRETGLLGGSYNPKYLAQYHKYHDGFDFVHFFTTFYPRELLQIPNRSIADLDQTNPAQRNRYANSFWTALYSETWGDHWLHVSGPIHEEHKLWSKRALMILALPLLPWIAIGLLRGAWAVVRAGPMQLLSRRDVLAIALMFVLGAALYISWATGTGLLPGKGSTIKFIYVAHLAPLVLTLALLVPLGPTQQRLLPVYAFALYLVSLPMATYGLAA